MLTKSNGGDNPFTEVDESGEDESTNTSQYEEQLHQWVNYGIYLAMINDDLDFAKAILVDLKKWRWQIRLYGIYLLEQDYTMASSLLNDLSDSTVDKGYFKNVQEINLKRLKVEEISSSEIQLLQTIGTSFEPSSGYARSLFYTITGIHLSVEIPTPETRTDSRSNDEFSKKATLEIFPNPTNDLININGKDLVSCSIYNIVGARVKFTSFNSIENQIDISNFESGVYFVAVKVFSGKIKTQRIIKL